MPAEQELAGALSRLASDQPLQLTGGNRQSGGQVSNPVVRVIGGQLGKLFGDKTGECFGRGDLVVGSAALTGTETCLCCLLRVAEVDDVFWPGAAGGAPKAAENHGGGNPIKRWCGHLRILTPAARSYPASVRHVITEPITVLHQYRECYTAGMPTTRARHMITESDHLAAALDEAATLWPELAGQRTALLRRIIDEGIDALEGQRHEIQQSRREAVLSRAGSMSGVWPAGWREQLHGEWPA